MTAVSISNVITDIVNNYVIYENTTVQHMCVRLFATHIEKNENKTKRLTRNIETKVNFPRHILSILV